MSSLNQICIYIAVCLVFASIAESQQLSCTNCQNSGFTAPPGGCNAAECVIYDLTSQGGCSLVSNEAPTGDATWKAGLNVNVDYRLRSGKIAAYQIQWSTGPSTWFVPGVNDLDYKFEGCGMRRMWSYFYDHTHSYIICS